MICPVLRQPGMLMAALKYQRIRIEHCSVWRSNSEGEILLQNQAIHNYRKVKERGDNENFIIVKRGRK